MHIAGHENTPVLRKWRRDGCPPVDVWLYMTLFCIPSSRIPVVALWLHRGAAVGEGRACAKTPNVRGSILDCSGPLRSHLTWNFGDVIVVNVLMDMSNIWGEQLQCFNCITLCLSSSGEVWWKWANYSLILAGMCVYTRTLKNKPFADIWSVIYILVVYVYICTIIILCNSNVVFDCRVEKWSLMQI